MCVNMTQRDKATPTMVAIGDVLESEEDENSEDMSDDSDGDSDADVPGSSEDGENSTKRELEDSQSGLPYCQSCPKLPLDQSERWSLRRGGHVKQVLS